MKIRTLMAVMTMPMSITVCPDCEVKTIHDALVRAAPHATITVKKGLYQEGEIIINRPVQLIGEDYPTVDGGNKSGVFTIEKTPGVTIRGFEIINSGESYIKELAGIRANESGDCVLEGNHLKNNAFGIYLAHSDRCQVRNNESAGTHAQDEASSGNGVHIWYSAGVTVEKNKVSDHRDGIYLEFVSESSIRDNFASENLRYGLHFMQSSKNEYLENTFTKNGAGVAVMYSHDIIMRRNHFVGNTGQAAYGLLLKDIMASQIAENEFHGNTVGIYMEGSNRSQFERNTFSDNGMGLKILGSCDNNSFTNNNFINNTFEVATNSSHFDNSFTENYWSHYDGYDLNHDGYGDKPFRPVSASAIILEHVDSSFILVGSFFFILVDEIERALPEMIPELLVDSRPRMKPYVVSNDTH